MLHLRARGVILLRTFTILLRMLLNIPKALKEFKMEQRKSILTTMMY